MPVCYVTTPFGKKPNRETGQLVDYDDVYQRAIKPAVEAAGCSVVRLDEYTGGGIIHKTMLRLDISSEIFIADIADGNANVMYEVGVRHASKRGAAILLSPAGNRVPFNISYSRVLIYTVGSDGRLADSEVERIRSLLRTTIEQALADKRNDSPVFEFFPGYTVEVPEDLRPPEVRSRQYSPELKQAIGRSDSSPKARRQTAREAEEIVKTSSMREDPSAAIEVLRKYRELGSWDDLIRFADELPPEVRDVVQIQQMLALALNRRNKEGDRDRALRMMEDLVAKTGGDAETRGILGRIYKDRYDLSSDPDDMRKAIAHYRAGFEREPSDYYTGINLVYLLMIYGGDEEKKEAQTVLPRVREALLARMDPDRNEYWELATALELAVMAGDWDSARNWAKRIVSQTPQRWMIESTLANMARLEKATDQSGLREIEELLRGAAVPEARNA